MSIMPQEQYEFKIELLKVKTPRVRHDVSVQQQKKNPDTSEKTGLHRCCIKMLSLYIFTSTTTLKVALQDLRMPLANQTSCKIISRYHQIRGWKIRRNAEVPTQPLKRKNEREHQSTEQ